MLRPHDHGLDDRFLLDVASGDHALDAANDDIAEAVDRAGTQSERMLAKLALLLANELGDRARVSALLEIAQQDL